MVTYFLEVGNRQMTDILEDGGEEEEEGRKKEKE
jgi:hypothetical protein